ncbi:MAG: vitamin K epoxide reductase family protein [Bacteroidota bacterium]
MTDNNTNINKRDLASLAQKLMVLLKVQVTDKFSEDLRLRPEYPTLLAVSNSLREINVKNLVVSLTTDQLGDIPFPCIAQMRSEESSFIIIQRMSEGRIHFLTERQQERSVGIADFSNEWTGVLLVAEVNDRSGDVNFRENKRLEFLSRARRVSAAALFFAVLLLTLSLDLSFAIPVLFSAIGLALGIALLMENLGQNNLLADVVCGTSSDTGCKAVMNSSVSKIYGDISLAEIVVIFFAGTLLSNLFLLTAGKPALNSVLFMLFILSAPVTLFSIYFQWRIIKSWCALCLGVTSVLWVELSFYAANFPKVWFSPSEFIPVAIAFLLCLSTWFVIRKSIMEAGKITPLRKSLYKFSKSQVVFDALLQGRNQISSAMDDAIVMGNPDATNTITFVSSPACGPCVEAHHEIDSWLNQCGDEIKIAFRFAVNPDRSGGDNVANTIARNLISLSLNGDKVKMQKAMASWYSHPRPDVNDWLSSLPAQLHPETESEFNRHHDWCLKQNVRTVPAVYFNDRQIPREFLFKDFENILKVKLSEV